MEYIKINLVKKFNSNNLRNILLFAFFLITFITIVFLSFDFVFAADVGNTFGGGGGSSRSSSGYSSSYGGSSSSGDLFFLFWIISALPFPLDMIVMVGLVLLGIFGTKKYKNSKVESNVKYVKNYEENVHNSIDENYVANILKKDDLDFSKNEFNAFAKDVYIKLQEAWEAKDWSAIRPFETEELFSIHSKQLEEYIQNETTPHLDKQEILSCQLADYEIDGKYQYLTVKLSATLLAFLTDKNGNVINGSPKNRVYREYKLVFKRTNGVKTVADTKTNTTNCPNCGAPNKITSSGVCEFCNSLITTGDYGWVLNEYSQWR